MNAADYFKQLANDLGQVVDKTVEQIAVIGQQDAQSTDLFKEHSPNGLKHNIIINNPGNYIREVFANKQYAYYLEYGNDQLGPFIYPRRAKALRFIVDGETIFAKYVRSHGPIPFMKHARDLANTKATSLLENNLQKWMSKYV